jgi:hypothetical protein
VAASTTSANTALPTVGESCVIFNATNGIAFVRFGTDNTVAASSAIDFPVPPGTRAILGCGSVASFAAAVLATGATAGSVYFSRGSGSQY